MFKISAIGTEGHTIIARNTPSEALRKAVELAGAGFSNVRIADRRGLLHTPESFERFFVNRKSDGNWIEDAEVSYAWLSQDQTA